MTFAVSFLLVSGLYGLVLGFTFLSFPTSRLSRYRFALSRGTMNLWNAGLWRIVGGGIFILLAWGLWNRSDDLMARGISLAVAGLIFTLLYFLQWMTAHITNLRPPPEIENGTLLYEPLVGYMGIENKPERNLRTDGWLALTKDSVIFKSPGREIRIPLTSIVGLGAGLWHKRKSHLCPVLRITYTENGEAVDAGFAMGRTRSWIDEILSSAGQLASKIAVAEKEIPRRACRMMYFKVYGFLSLTVLFLASLLATLVRL